MANKIKSKKIATDSNYLRCHALLTARHFPLETTWSCKKDRKERYWGQQFWPNGKGHFGPTDRNDQTGHGGPPSKLVPNIPVGSNRNGPFHLMYQPKLPEFWVEWKAPRVLSRSSLATRNSMSPVLPLPGGTPYMKEVRVKF